MLAPHNVLIVAGDDASLGHTRQDVLRMTVIDDKVARSPTTWASDLPSLRLFLHQHYNQTSGYVRALQLQIID